MESIISLSSGRFSVDLAEGVDISIPIRAEEKSTKAWYIGSPKIEPVQSGSYIAEVAKGATINFNTILFSPHAHGTHTESYGHISKEFYSVSNCLDKNFFKAKLISLTPKKEGEDRVFDLGMFQQNLKKDEAESLIIRNLPNTEDKLTKNHDHTNWPYLKPDAAAYIRDCGIEHLLIDLPSVDREEGDVLAHKAFFDYPENPRKNATITELIYIPDEVEDGFYILNLSVANFINNAAPSRPILYRIKEELR